MIDTKENHDNIVNSKNMIKCTISGKVKNITSINELVKGNKTRDDYVFLFVEFHMINDINYKKKLGTSKIYLPISKCKSGDLIKYGIIKNRKLKRWKTNISPNLINERFMNANVEISGTMKREDNENYTHFMTNLSQITIYIKED